MLGSTAIFARDRPAGLHRSGNPISDPNIYQHRIKAGYLTLLSLTVLPLLIILPLGLRVDVLLVGLVEPGVRVSLWNV